MFVALTLRSRRRSIRFEPHCGPFLETIDCIASVADFIRSPRPSYRSAFAMQPNITRSPLVRAGHRRLPSYYPREAAGSHSRMAVFDEGSCRWPDVGSVWRTNRHCVAAHGETEFTDLSVALSWRRSRRDPSFRFAKYLEASQRRQFSRLGVMDPLLKLCPGDTAPPSRFVSR